MTDYVRWLNELGMNDVPVVGGKNASLGEMIQHLTQVGVQVPGGFATTAEAYRDFLAESGLDARIATELEGLDIEDIAALSEAGPKIRGWIIEQPFQPELDQAIEAAYKELTAQAGNTDCSWAVRSSATAEDLPDASFAGQQETFLNVHGLDNIMRSIKEVFASLYNDRAISYRVHQGFAHAEVALSAGIQRMVRSDLGASGVMFTLDTESGFRDAVFITATYGLGEMVVQGAVNPDEFYVHKPTLAAGRPAILRRGVGDKAIRMVYAEPGSKEPVRTEDVPEADRHQFSITDAEIENLAHQAILIEQHYGRPMDIEWGKDGNDGKLYVLQARPETVQSRSGKVIKRYHLQGKGDVLATGRSIGQRIGAGKARIVESIRGHGAGPARRRTGHRHDRPGLGAGHETRRGHRHQPRRAHLPRRHHRPRARRTRGGRLQRRHRPHHRRQEVTVSCAEGDTGFIYDGDLPFEHKTVELDKMPEVPVKLMMNVGNPERAFAFSATPNAGIGLARLEFIINNTIGIHPKALLDFDQLPEDLKARSARASPRIRARARSTSCDKIEGVATLAAAFAPNPVIVRLSDFKSNEYANLVGGDATSRTRKTR